MTDLARDLVAVPAPRVEDERLLARFDELPAPHPSRSQLACKRALDVALGSVLALLVLPVVAVFAVVAALTLRSSPFFVQWRHGTRGQQLRVVKLRSLPKDFPAYADKALLATRKLPRFGLWMRRHHLDELPQLFEVVTGRMSLVGPRPRMCGGVEPIDPGYDALRRQVNQGCTGLWQISVASDGVATGVPAYDLFYLRHMSLRLDLWIIARTVVYLLGLADPIALDDIPRWVLRRQSLAALVPYPADPVVVADAAS